MRKVCIRFFLCAVMLTCVQCVYADEQDYAGQEKMVPDQQRGSASYTATFTIVKDPSLVYTLDFGDGTAEGKVVCKKGGVCATVAVQHVFVKPGVYPVVLYRAYPDDADATTGKMLRGVAARSFVTVAEKNPIEPAPLCKRWFNGCVECSRAKQGGEMACPKKQCFGALKERVCKEEFYINKVPRVTVVGPATSTEGLERQWRVDGVDPEKEKMTFGVRWGDEAVSVRTKVPQTIASHIFAHTYMSPGTFTVTAYAKDASGGIGTATAKIYIRDAYAGVTCTKEYIPVCGIRDGELHTYPNECSLRKARATKKHNGEC